MLVRHRVGAFALASLVLACARSSSPVSSVEPTADVVDEPLVWGDVAIVGDRICATDERQLAWCWHAHALDVEPLPVVLHTSHWSYTNCFVPIEHPVLVRPGCMREGDAIQCVDGSRSWTVSLSEPADELELTGTHACARHPTGQVSCWTDAGDVVKVDGLEDARVIVVGEEAACALQGEGRLSCWAVGSASAVTLAVPEVAPEPTVIVEIVETSQPRWSTSLTILAPLSPMPELHSRLHDRLHPLFAPYALDLDIAELVYTRPAGLHP